MAQASDIKAVSVIIDVMRNDPGDAAALGFALAVADLVTPSPTVAKQALAILVDQLAKAHGLSAAQLKAAAVSTQAVLRPPQEFGPPILEECA